MEKQFIINMEELMLLTRACIPAIISKQKKFLKRMVDEIFFNLNQKEIDQIFDYILINIETVMLNDKYVDLFMDRYDSALQYKIVTPEKTMFCFLHDQKYYATTNVFFTKEQLKDCSIIKI
jgi:hypothetical protein